MRDFFKQMLSDQYSMNGFREVEYMTDQQLTTRLDYLVKKCKQYDYIPQQVQKQTIEKGMLDIPHDYKGLTPNQVEKWLYAICDKYWKAKQGEEIKDYVETEISPETAKAIQQYLTSLTQGVTRIPDPHRISSDIQKIKAEDKERQEGKKGLATNYKPADQEYLIMSNLRTEYGRTHCDLHSGKPKPGSPSFDEFVKMKSL